MAPKLYMFRASPAVRAVLMTARALDLDLEHVVVDFIKQEHLAPEYLEINPQHTVPTLDDEGLRICDSHAINAYLVGKYGKDDSLYPKDLYKRALVDQRLYFECGTLFPLLRTVDYGYINKEIKEVPSNLVQEFEKVYGFLEKFLEGKLWITGDTVTIADFSIYPTMSCLSYHVGVDPDLYPNITGWRKRAEVHPYFVSEPEEHALFVNFFNSLKAEM